ncbi:peptidase S8/S53 subtilisin kexin sedolisin [Robertmurraya yapensis]|uniref:Peptidase S8/S53 subtilisin kexin sedolisin n=2 Tax=Bacillaceae TaxID=186817 RepID=A0A3S0IJD4_9BACI|nr:S8 family peptidase [Bacillus yapensis]RTR33814.1 peptidase S8/S53 subtilisin kexin sedolisin [Bacillus yapensis]TKS97132.1 peptidase S8/S53 subtilisin kexin sedolisin [Bacillus yapensis]
MKKLLFFLILTSLLISMSPPVHADINKENVIIVFKDEIDQKAIENVNGEIQDEFNNLPVVTGEIPEAAIEILERDKDVLAIEIDQRVSITAQNPDWGINTIEAPAAWNSQLTGKGVKIAVLDTGISPHEDLIVSGGISFTSYTKSYTDDNGHGTHVAGIIGAERNAFGTVGVAPDADVYAVKVLDKSGSGYLSDIIRGIDWAISNKMDIINLSLTATADSVALHQAVDNAYNQGILVVAAAGNHGNGDGTGDTVEYPARYESVIAVSATDYLNQRGSFSATGNSVEVSAPGVKILSTYLNNSYVSMSGTSMATPYVAGTLALMKQAYPTYTNIQLRKNLVGSTQDLGVAGKDAYFGYGLVKAPVIVNSVQQEKATETPVNTEVKTPINNTHQPAKQPTPQVINTVPKKQEVKPPIKKNMVTTLSTTASSYKVGKTVVVSVKVVDKGTRKALANSAVKLTITPPKGKAKVVTLKTNSKGQASYKMATNKYTTKGNYKLTTATSIANYNTAYSSKSIRIK